MERQRISSGGPWEERIGYSRAVVADGWVFVSGCTGADPQSGTMPDSVVAQCRNTLETIRGALAQAGCDLGDVVRVTYVLPRREDFEPCWPLLREAFGAARPAAMMIEAGLIDPAMKIEIEVTARQP